MSIWITRGRWFVSILNPAFTHAHNSHCLRCSGMESRFKVKRPRGSNVLMLLSTGIAAPAEVCCPRREVIMIRRDEQK